MRPTRGRKQPSTDADGEYWRAAQRRLPMMGAALWQSKRSRRRAKDCRKTCNGKPEDGDTAKQRRPQSPAERLQAAIGHIEVDVDDRFDLMAALIVIFVVVNMAAMQNAGVLIRLRMRMQRAARRQQDADAQKYAQETRQAAHGGAVYPGLALKRQPVEHLKFSGSAHLKLSAVLQEQMRPLGQRPPLASRMACSERNQMPGPRDLWH
jgi:hypothetical protein